LLYSTNAMACWDDYWDDWYDDYDDYYDDSWWDDDYYDDDYVWDDYDDGCNDSWSDDGGYNDDYNDSWSDDDGYNDDYNYSWPDSGDYNDDYNDSWPDDDGYNDDYNDSWPDDGNDDWSNNYDTDDNDSHFYGFDTDGDGDNDLFFVTDDNGHVTSMGYDDEDGIFTYEHFGHDHSGDSDSDGFDYSYSDNDNDDLDAYDDFDYTEPSVGEYHPNNNNSHTTTTPPTLPNDTHKPLPNEKLFAKDLPVKYPKQTHNMNCVTSALATCQLLMDGNFTFSTYYTDLYMLDTWYYSHFDADIKKVGIYPSDFLDFINGICQFDCAIINISDIVSCIDNGDIVLVTVNGGTHEVIVVGYYDDISGVDAYQCVNPGTGEYETRYDYEFLKDYIIKFPKKNK